MFKCTDCNKMFEVKPDYCDCGNNVFEEIITEQKSAPVKKTEPNPQFKKMMESVDILSVSIFGICILLSILAILFLANPKKEDEVSKTLDMNTQENTETLNIPKIDEFWNNDLPKVEVKEEVQKKKIEEPVIQQVVEKPQIVKQVQKPVTKKVTPVQKPVVKKVTQTQKTVTQKPQTPVKTQTSAVKKSTTATNPQTVVNSYKTSLRNALFSKLDLTKVSGTGLAVVQFSIDENGKLTNRNFVQQSGNKKLDDAVYNMLMSMPYYNIPPSGYKGEMMKLSISFNYGQYNFYLR